MYGKNKVICIAGKNQCSIDFLKFTAKKIKKRNILVLPNKSDKGKLTWQPSLRSYAEKNNFKITNLKSLYKIENLIFISIEFEELINLKNFKSKELFNFHFSLLPKYRGCHTNFFQLYFGEKNSGVTLHKIDNGIDTGPIISNIKFKININDNALVNYKRLMKSSSLLYKKNFVKIIKNNYKEKKQNNKRSTYFSRSSVNYDKMKHFSIKNMNLKFFHRIKAFIFPPLQLPVVNSKLVKNIRLINKKIVLTYL
ncbi:MAG: hypothetical protein CNC05_04045 [Pelagibacterales bacterium MED-G42]|nr:MAG: hypothetical protein CNC05_04045 [Pelagibacterales bacterium MED-G42]